MRTTTLTFFLALTLLGADAAAQESCSTTRQSLKSSGQQNSFGAGSAEISGDGAWLTFLASDVTYVGLPPVFGPAQVFRKNIASGQYELVTRTPGGLSAGNKGSYHPRISNDGRYIAFETNATNLDSDVPGPGVFRWDGVTGEIRRVDLRPDGGVPSLDGDDPDISPDGRYVAFRSGAQDLVVPTNQNGHIYVRDMDSNQLWRASELAPGVEHDGAFVGRPTLSAQGLFVAFESDAKNLLGGAWVGPLANRNVFVWDRATGTTAPLSFDLGQTPNTGVLTHDPHISDDGRFVSFVSEKGDLVPGDGDAVVDVFLADRTNGTLIRVTTPPGGGSAGIDCFESKISGDGSTIVFETRSNAFDPSDTTPLSVQDIYAYDVPSGQFERASVGSDGQQADANGFDPHVSFDGQRIVWASNDTGLVPGDTNNYRDILMRNCQPAVPPNVYCTAKASSAGCVARIGTSDPAEGAAADGGDYSVIADDIQGGKNGIFFVGLAGPAALPFLNGVLCVQPPLQRTPIQPSGGSGPSSCDGQFQLVVNTALTFPNQVPGGAIWVQSWYRDPAGDGTALSDAVEIQFY